MADTSGITSVLDQVIAQYSAGGGYAQARGTEQAVLEKKATSGKKQALVSGGLAGTTVAASIPTSVYEEISQPFMTQTEQIRTSSLMDAYMAKAGYLQQQQALDQQQQLAQDQIAAQKYSSSMAAAAQVHGGGGGGGDSSAQSMVDSWRNWDRDDGSSSSSSAGGTSGSGGSSSFGGTSLFDDYTGGGVYGGAYYPAGSSPGSGSGAAVISSPDATASMGGEEKTDLEKLAEEGEQWMNLDQGDPTSEYPESDDSGPFKWITIFGSRFKQRPGGGVQGGSI